MHFDRDVIRGRAEELFSRAKDKFGPADKWMRTFVHERPMVALAGALGFGYFVGRLFKKSR